VPCRDLFFALGFGITNGDKRNSDKHHREVLNSVETMNTIFHPRAISKNAFHKRTNEIQKETNDQLEMHRDQRKQMKFRIAALEGSIDSAVTIDNRNDKKYQCNPTQKRVGV